MHRLTEVRIQNYKSIRDLTFPLSSYTPLDGPNNGKFITSLTSATNGWKAVIGLKNISGIS